MAKSKRPEASEEVLAGIGRRMRWARELVMPNRAEFARLLGLDRSTLCKVEEGRRAPTVFLILDVAHKLKVTPSYLLDGSLLGSDEEIALRLVKEHPELVVGPGRMASTTGGGTSDPPMRQEGGRSRH